MSDAGISPELQAFIARHIDSVVQLEALLLLYGTPDRGWTAEATARELRIDAHWAENQLMHLKDHGLLSCDPASVRAYRYQPATEEIAALADGLARAYADRRVSVITLIYSKPPTAPASPSASPPAPSAPAPADPLKSFADAFRLRKDNGNG